MQALFQRFRRDIQRRHHLDDGVSAPDALDNQAVPERLVQHLLRNIALKLSEVDAPQQADEMCIRDSSHTMNYKAYAPKKQFPIKKQLRNKK